MQEIHVPTVTYTRLWDGSHQFKTPAGQMLVIHENEDRELTAQEQRNAALMLAWAAAGLHLQC